MLIAELWRRQPGKFFCLTTKSGSGEWREHFFSREEFSTLRDFLRKHNDKDIYFCPHGFSQRRRRKEFAELPSMLWADLDAVDPSKVKWKPTIAIESSPGRHVGLWLVDRAMTEELNQRLTYCLGADRGGWDLTQVLRVPGTTNYKYRSAPRVRLLWEDGPSYVLDDLERQIPKKIAQGTEDAKSLFKRHAGHLPYWVRNELLEGRPEQGKRSDMLWKLEHALHDARVPRDEAFVLLKASPWNKFKGRASEDDQLTRELVKIYGEEKNGYRFLTKSLAEVEEENVEWLWYPYLARREVTIIEGDPGIGKSYLAQMIAKALADGERLPSVKHLATVKGKIAYFDIENDPSTVTKKRMYWNQCKNPENFYQEEEPFRIDDHEALKYVYEAIERLRPIAVFFDTVNYYIGKTDTSRATEVSQAMHVFKDIARRFNCSVVILRHLTKGNVKDQRRALYRGQGNIAMGGTSRIVITVGTDPEDEDTKVLSVTKINLARKPRALTFTLIELPDTLRERDRSKFKWGGFTDLSSDDILGIAKKETSRDIVVSFLREELSEGERKAQEIKVMAEKRSISERTLQRAADELGVKKILRGFGSAKMSYWALPERHHVLNMRR